MISFETFQGIDPAIATHAFPNLTLRSLEGPEWGVPKKTSANLQLQRRPVEEEILPT